MLTVTQISYETAKKKQYYDSALVLYRQWKISEETAKKNMEWRLVLMLTVTQISRETAQKTGINWNYEKNYRAGVYPMYCFYS